MTVAVVTDSTCDLSSALLADLGVRAVPLTVTADDGTGGEVTGAALSALLADPSALPTTSQPPTPRFLDAWADAAAGGADEIVSLHVGGALSGTFAHSRRIAHRSPVPTTVVDSEQVSGGLALQVLAAARVAAGGGDVADVLAGAARTRARTVSVLAVDTTEHLRRGGRFTGGADHDGGGLHVRPVLAVSGTGLHVVDRVRTWPQAIARMVSAVAASDVGPFEVVVAHAGAPARADRLAGAVRAGVDVTEEHRVLVGPVVGVHIGPGAVGVAAVPVTR